MRQFCRIRIILSIFLTLAILSGLECSWAGAATSHNVSFTNHTKSTINKITGKSKYSWSLTNLTGVPIYGNWAVEEGGHTSQVNILNDAPLEDSKTVSTEQDDMLFYKAYWIGHICYNHTWWDLNRSNFSKSHIFNLGRQGDNLYVYFRGTSSAALTNSELDC